MSVFICLFYFTLLEMCALKVTFNVFFLGGRRDFEVVNKDRGGGFRIGPQ